MGPHPKAPDRPFFRCCGAVGCWTVRRAGTCLESTVLPHQHSQLLLVTIVSLPSVGKGIGCESLVNKAILISAGQKGESLAFKCLTIKPHLPPASLGNTHSLLPTLLFAWPKDVKISLAKRKKKKEKKIQTLEYFIVNRKCANLCFYVDFARRWNGRED